MRKNIKDFIKNCSDILPLSEPIYEFGAMQVEGQEGFADLRPFFKGKEYIGCDYREGLGVDDVIDVHDTKLQDKSIGTIICCDTLEHITNPIQAMSEFKRILKDDGIIIITSVMNFPIHSYPYDYWRFTPQCFMELLADFNHINVQYAGYKLNPHTVVGIASNKFFDLPKLKKDKCYLKYLDYFIPQGLLDIYRFLKRNLMKNR